MYKDLSSFIKKYYKVKSNSTDFAYAWETMLLYLVGTLTAYEYQSRMKILPSEESTKNIRLALISSGYTFQAKMAVLQAVKEKITVKDIQEKWSITDRDCALLDASLEDKHIAKCVRKRLKGIPKGFVFDWENVFYESHKEVLKYIRSIAYKKLLFISHSHSVPISDFHSELEESSLRSFYKVWPTTITPLYLTNYLKRSVHNRVINIIKSETTLKRGRKVKVSTDSNGVHQFNLLEANENTLGRRSDAEGMPFNYADLQSDSDKFEGVFKFEIKISVQQILEKYKHTPKKYAYLMILLGNENEEFTQWLRLKRYISTNEDNVDFQERVSTYDFNKFLNQYIRISKHTGEVFLLRIKIQLGYENGQQLTT